MRPKRTPGSKFRLSVFCLFLFLSLTASADEYSDLKSAINGRRPQLSILRREGLVIEGELGLLERLQPLTPPQAELVNAENRERLRMFSILSSKLSRSSDSIAQEFARLAIAAAARERDSAPQSKTSSPSPSQMPAVPEGQSSSPTQPPPQQQTPPPVPLAPAAPAKRNPSHVSIEDKVLTQPFASIFSEPSRSASLLRENVPTFSTFYIHERAEGWFKIGGDTTEKAVGWIRDTDAVEWKQSMLVRFSDREDLSKVLMFNDREKLKSLLGLSRNDRANRVNDFYQAIETGNIPDEFPVSAIAPRIAVGMNAQMMPILDSLECRVDQFEGRLLKVAAVAQTRGATNIRDTETRRSTISLPDFGTSDVRSRNIDLVFAMDTTLSMGPFLEKTLRAIEGIAKTIENSDSLSRSVRFGFWGFRDDSDLIPNIEYTTRNYTPVLKDVASFLETLQTVKETKTDSIDFEEEVLAGFHDAVTKTKWRDDSIRLLILVGDAPGRKPGFKSPHYRNGPVGTKAKMDVHELRTLANENSVFVSGLFLKHPRFREYWAPGIAQFRTLASNPNGITFTSLNAADPSEYERWARVAGVQLLKFKQNPAEALTGGGVESIEATGSPEEKGAVMMNQLFRGAVAQWLGKKKAAKVPQDLVAWISDKDLRNGARQSLLVRVFLTKGQLNALKVCLSEVLDAATRNKVTGEGFFKALRAIVVVAGKDPSKVQKATTLQESGIIPDFLRNLPYKSKIMDMNDDQWRNLSANEQQDLMEEINSKLTLYAQLHDTPEKWRPLSPGDESDNWVSEIDIDNLP
jgi:serine/threonine-protein kinase PpkA